MMLEQSKMIFNEFTNGNPKFNQSSNFTKTDPRNMSKTNPI